MIAGPGVLLAKRFLTRARLLIASSGQRHLRARSCREIHLGWIHNAVFNRGLTAGAQNEEKVEPQHFFYKVHSSTEEMGSVQEAPGGTVWPDLREKIGLGNDGGLACLQTFLLSLRAREREWEVLSKYSGSSMVTLTGRNNVSCLPHGQECVLPQYPRPRVDHGLGGWRNEQDRY